MFENRGDRPVRFADTRISAFLGAPGHLVLLAADPGCGYGMRSPKAPIEAGVCATYLDAFIVEPHASVRRTITLFKELRGMAPLTQGTYVFEKPIRFQIGRTIPDEDTGRSAVVRLVYEVESSA